MQSPGMKNAELVAPQSNRARWNTEDDGVARTLKVWEHNLEIAIEGGLDGTLTMPDVVEASGSKYYIRLLDDGTSNNKAITLSFPGNPKISQGPTSALADANTWATGNTLTADDDYLVLESTGVVWLVIANVTT